MYRFNSHLHQAGQDLSLLGPSVCGARGLILSQEHKGLSQGWTMEHNLILQKVTTG